MVTYSIAMSILIVLQHSPCQYPSRGFKSLHKQKNKYQKILVFVGGEGAQPNQGVRFNPTIHYIPYKIVMERTKEYLEK